MCAVGRVGLHSWCGWDESELCPILELCPKGQINDNLPPAPLSLQQHVDNKEITRRMCRRKRWRQLRSIWIYNHYNVAESENMLGAERTVGLRTQCLGVGLDNCQNPSTSRQRIDEEDTDWQGIIKNKTGSFSSSKLLSVHIRRPYFMSKKDKTVNVWGGGGGLTPVVAYLYFSKRP